MKRLKKILITASLLLCFGYAPVAGAQIPVTDGAHIGTSIMNQIETIEQWAQQIEQMKEQIDKAQETLDALKGGGQFGNLLNSVPKNPLPKDIGVLMTGYKSMPGYGSERTKYPTFEDAPKANAMFDAIAGQNATYQYLYTETTKRVDNIDALMTAINQAKDPGDKLDLANRLSIEQSTVSSNMNLIKVYESLSRSQLEQAEQAARDEWACQQFGRTGC
jgi:hypothetical protein